MIFIRRSEPPGSAARVRLGSVATAIGLVVVVMFAYRAEASPPVVTLTRSVVWAELDANVLHGRLSRLAWSDDRSTVYLQTVEGNKVVLSGSARANDSYDVGANPYTTIVATSDADRKAAAAMSQQILAQIAVFLRRQARS